MALCVGSTLTLSILIFWLSPWIWASTCILPTLYQVLPRFLHIGHPTKVLLHKDSTKDAEGEPQEQALVDITQHQPCYKGFDSCWWYCCLQSLIFTLITHYFLFTDSRLFVMWKSRDQNWMQISREKIVACGFIAVHLILPWIRLLSLQYFLQILPLLLGRLFRLSLPFLPP